MYEHYLWSCRKTKTSFTNQPAYCFSDWLHPELDTWSACVLLDFSRTRIVNLPYTPPLHRNVRYPGPHLRPAASQIYYSHSLYRQRPPTDSLPQDLWKTHTPGNPIPTWTLAQIYHETLWWKKTKYGISETQKASGFFYQQYECASIFMKEVMISASTVLHIFGITSCHNIVPFFFFLIHFC
jgi:hypothetical protein